MDRPIYYKLIYPECCNCGCTLHGTLHDVDGDLYCEDCFDEYISELRSDTEKDADDYVEEEMH